MADKPLHAKRVVIVGGTSGIGLAVAVAALAARASRVAPYHARALAARSAMFARSRSRNAASNL